MNIVEVQDLKKKFGKFTAVDGISFNVVKGEIFGFLGPNGAGKTTTINMLCTLQKPYGGNATVNGYDIVKHRNQVRKSIGLVFQDPTLDEYLTGEQNLKFHAYAYNVPKNICNQRMTELLKLVELSDRRHSKVRTYSGGMKRRLELARGLLHRPQVLFLDEPTLGLDPQTRRRIWEYINMLREHDNLTIFLTTHYMDEAENCNRIAIIDYGHIIALNTPDKLKDELGGDLVTLKSDNNQAAIQELKDRYQLSPEIHNGVITFCVPQGEKFLPDFVRGFQSRLLSIGVHRPTLDDVFLRLTGHAIRDHEADSLEQMKSAMRPSR